MASPNLVPVIFIGLALAGCRSANADKPSDRSGVEPSSRAAVAPPTAPALSALRESWGIRGDQPVEAHGSPVTPALTKKFKNHGGLGELLESDLYYFTAESLKPCGEPAKAAAGGSGTTREAPIVVGAKVRIKAKSRLTFSPRELRLYGGGIVFGANMDLERELKGCTPLLKVSWLKKDDVIEGFVLFDVPPPEPKKLELLYHPTRWGGAALVRVALPECVSCGGNPAAAKSGAVQKPAAGGY
jgi:hypothetical protein